MGSRGVVALTVVAFLIVFFVPPFGAVAGLMLSVVAIVFAVRAIRSTRPQPQELLTPEGAPITVNVPVPGHGTAITALVLGVLAALLSVFVLTALLVFADQIKAYQDCRSGANTSQAESHCWDQLRDSLNQKIER